MSKVIGVFVMLVFLFFGFSVFNPALAETGIDYSAGQLKRLIDSGKPVFLLNPLSEIEFNQAHIPGSVNIPVSKIRKTDKLPKDKETHIVTYCKGPK